MYVPVQAEAQDHSLFGLSEKPDPSVVLLGFEPTTKEWSYVRTPW